MNLVCVFGAGWAGSTVLSYVLGALPDAATCGEAHALVTRNEEHLAQDFACVSCQSWACPIFSKEFVAGLDYAELYSQLYARYGVSFLIVSDKQPSIYAKTLVLHESVRRVVLFKRPEAHIWSGLRRTLLPLDTWVSSRERMNNVTRKKLAQQRLVSRLASMYSTTYREVFNLTKPGDVYLPYDVFAAEPACTMPSVCERIGLVWQPSALNYWRYTHHAVGGNLFVNQEPQPITLDVSWHDGLTAEDLEIVAGHDCREVFAELLRRVEI
jgi:hypothetical protein